MPVRRIEYKLGSTHTYHYEAYEPDEVEYALLLCHGGGGWGGMYDDFCYPYIEKHKVDIWAWDQPGFGQTGNRGHFDMDVAYAALQDVVKEIRTQHDKPIFVMGNSFGGAVSSASLYIDEVAGAVATATTLVMGTQVSVGLSMMLDNPVMDGFLSTPFGQASYVSLDEMINWEENYGDPKRGREICEHPQHQGSLRLSSWSSIAKWKLPHPIAENKKPFMLIVAERDPMIPGGVDSVNAVFEGVGGPTKLVVRDSDKHQLMLFDTDWFIEQLDSWCKDSM